jgi:carbon storage regulator
MLVLSRKRSESLHIGDDVTVTVLEVRGNVVRLGIHAPSSVRVLRAELTHWDERPATGPRRELSMAN